MQSKHRSLSPAVFALALGAGVAGLMCGGSNSGGDGTGSSSGGNGGSGGGSDNGSSGTSSGDNGSSGTSSGSSSTAGGSGSGGTGMTTGKSGSGSSGSSSGHTSSSGSSTASSSGSTAGSSGGAPSSTYLPTVTGTCPTFATGMATFAGQQVQLWTGTGSHGPILLFWHGTGEQSSDATLFLGQATISAVTAAGGVVASFNSTTSTGTDSSGDGVWYTGDFATADEVVACAIKSLGADSSRIFVSGDSAGGLQTVWMAYARSGYVASVAPISGGLVGANGFYLDPTTTPQDSSNTPAAIVTHGAEGVDVVGLDFAVASAAYEADINMKGGFSVDCNTGGGHVSGPPAISPAIWQFFQDHPFKVKDTYTSGLPSSFPSYCKIGPRLADGGV